MFVVTPDGVIATQAPIKYVVYAVLTRIFILKAERLGP